MATGSPAAHDSGRWVDGIGIGCITGARLYCVANYQLLFFDGFDRTEDASRWSVVSP